MGDPLMKGMQDTNNKVHHYIHDATAQSPSCPPQRHDNDHCQDADKTPI